MKFRDMKINDRTIAALEEIGYLEATEVQETTIPLVIDGKELAIRSQTGTGKTAAFGIGLIELIIKDRKKKALILAPTRELALQITNELRSIARKHRMLIYAIYGGQDIGPQIRFLKNGFDIVVATPGRLLDHSQRGSISLGQFNLAVLDEADRMLDMGFKEDIDLILNQISPQRQLMLFSATLDNQVKAIARNYMSNPEIIELGKEGKVEKIDEEIIRLSRRDKLSKLKEILQKEPTSRIIIFVATKRSAEFVCDKLNMDGINARYLHGGKTQNQREHVMRSFKEGNFRILVATDLAARGLHIEEVSHIINYDQANSTEMHTHRVGRTGRMGKAGKAITFVETDPYATNNPHRGNQNRNRGRYPSRRFSGSDRTSRTSRTPRTSKYLGQKH